MIMGMFDRVRCRYPLPWFEVQEVVWQSKDTPAQFLDQYEIREDGTLWHEAYTLRVEETEESMLGFYLHRDDEHWVPVSDFCGELEIHHTRNMRTSPRIEYSVRFWFRDGKVKDIIPIKGRHGSLPASQTREAKGAGDEILDGLKE